MTQTVASIETAETGLHISGVSKNVRKRSILQDVAFHVRRGEVVALLGPNGAGKTSCFHTVVGLVQADEGEIVLDGTNITHWPMYRRARAGLGYLPQETSVFRGMTVEQNLLSVLESVEKNPHTRRERLEELLGEFGLTRLRRSPAPALSGGERRRVEIARALAARPAYMLLDEPFAGVDPIAVGEVRQLVANLKNRGMGVLITDHNVRETLKIVDHACILHEGRVIKRGTPEEIVADNAVREVYLGADFQLA